MNIKEVIRQLVAEATGWSPADIPVEKPKNRQADYAVGVFAAAKKEGKNPQDVAKEIAEKLSSAKSSEIDRVEVSGGYVNFFLSEVFLQKQLFDISSRKNMERTIL